MAQISFILQCLGLLTALAIAPVGCATATGGGVTGGPGRASSYVEQLAAKATLLLPQVESVFAAKFLRATDALPRVETWVVYAPRERRATNSEELEGFDYLDVSGFERLPPSEREKFEAVVVDEEYFYAGKWGSPLAYTRPLDILGRHAQDAPKSLLDFGYGAVGHLMGLAAMGVNVTGIDVDPLLPVLYADYQRDQIQLLSGHFPSDNTVRDAAGGSYDCILSKNVLKRGYVHPDGGGSGFIDFGMSDEEVLREFYNRLTTGGLFLIYNIMPPQSPVPNEYRPAADGRAPFSEDAFKAVGFEVLAYNLSDDAALRKMGRTLGWENVDSQFFAMYTLLRKSTEAEP